MKYGSATVELLLVLIGVFLAIAAYSRKPVLLKLATLGSLQIDPDHPGTAARRMLFIAGMIMIGVGVLLLFLERLHDLGLLT